MECQAQRERTIENGGKKCTGHGIGIDAKAPHETEDQDQTRRAENDAQFALHEVVVLKERESGSVKSGLS